MRALLGVIAATLLAGCAGIPTTDSAKTFDVTTTYSTDQQQSEFVGTGAKSDEGAMRSAGWYRFGPS